jgi:hypothetical protein
MFRFEEGVAGGEDEIDLKKKEKWCVHVGTGKPRKPPGTAALLARGWITGGVGTRT